MNAVSKLSPRIRDDAYYVKAAESHPSKVAPTSRAASVSRAKPSARDRDLVSQLRSHKPRAA